MVTITTLLKGMPQAYVPYKGIALTAFPAIVLLHEVVAHVSNNAAA
jgi:hypothetical protein